MENLYTKSFVNCELNGLADMYVQCAYIRGWFKNSVSEMAHTPESAKPSTTNTFLVRYIFIYFNFVFFLFFFFFCNAILWGFNWKTENLLYSLSSPLSLPASWMTLFKFSCIHISHSNSHFHLHVVNLLMHSLVY